MQKKLLEKIYEARSKYVHKGIDINLELIDTIKRICKVILEILFYIQGVPRYKEKDSFSLWIKELDYAVSAIEALKELPEEDHAKIGIGKINI